MAQKSENALKELPRNLWVVSATSFLMDVSSEMVINILPLFLSAVLGVKTNIIGLHRSTHFQFQSANNCNLET